MIHMMVQLVFSELVIREKRGEFRLRSHEMRILAIPWRTDHLPVVRIAAVQQTMASTGTSVCDELWCFRTK